MSDIFRQIKGMRIRSATRIAIAALEYLQNYAKKNGFGPDFDKQATKLAKLRPTAVAYENAFERLMEEKTFENLWDLINQLKNAKQEIGKNGKKIFKKSSVVMTHCESTEALAVMVASKSKIKYVYVTETRPIYQGLSTAKDLRKARIKNKLIIDGAIGYYMPDVDLIVVGSDALRKEGLVNKVGTLPLAIVAKAYGVPVYVAGNTFKLDQRKKFIIEERNPTEIHAPIKGVEIRNPVFDITPWKYVTAVITEKGIYKPEQLVKMIK